MATMSTIKCEPTALKKCLNFQFCIWFVLQKFSVVGFLFDTKQKVVSFPLLY